MNRAETWKPCAVCSARQQTGQSIEDIQKKMEALRRSRIEDTNTTALQLADTLMPVAEVLHHLTEEARAAISRNEQERRNLNQRTLTAATQVTEAAKEAREAAQSFNRVRSLFTVKILGWCVLVAMLSTLPLTGRLGWQWWTNHTAAMRWHRIVQDMDSYIVEIHPDMRSARTEQIDAVYRKHGLLPPSRRIETEPAKPSNGN